MLSEGDRRRLAEIELSLVADDPGFVDRFQRRRDPRRRRHTMAAIVVLVVCVVGVGVALGYHNVAGAVIGLVALATTVGLWLNGHAGEIQAAVARRRRSVLGDGATQR
jgi:Protein of unknown function (DUF3040)